MGWLKSLLDLLKSLFAKKAQALPAPEPIESNPVVEPYTSEQLNQMVVDEARHWLGTKESGNNRGSEVDQFNLAVAGQVGEPWCMSFAQFCIEQVEKKTGVQSKVFDSAHCMTVWNQSPKECKVPSPVPGALMVWNFVGTTSGHVGVVQKQLPDTRIDTIEGNTGSGNPDDVVREGDGVYERSRARSGSSKMRVMGFLKPF